MEMPSMRQAGPAARPQASADPVPASGASAPLADTPADVPPVPDDIREAARRAPDHWLGMVDPGWTAEEPPPEWAVIGEWRSGLSGQVEEWRPNDDYRPSPQMLGWPEPSDPVDAAVQLAVTGYGPLEDAVRALSAAEVAVLRAPGGGPLVATGPDGTPVVPVFTSVPHHLFTQGLAHDTVPARELADHLAADGTALSVNPVGPAHLVVGADEVLRAQDATLSGDTPRSGDATLSDDATPSGDAPAPTTTQAAPDPHLPTSTGRTP